MSADPRYAKAVVGATGVDAGTAVSLPRSLPGAKTPFGRHCCCWRDGVGDEADELKEACASNPRDRCRPGYASAPRPCDHAVHHRHPLDPRHCKQDTGDYTPLTHVLDHPRSATDLMHPGRQGVQARGNSSHRGQSLLSSLTISSCSRRSAGASPSSTSWSVTADWRISLFFARVMNTRE